MEMKLPITTDRKAGSRRSERGDFFITKPAFLTLSDGTVFEGKSPNGQTGPYFGEVVFNTGMTGYVESLTDPSYAGQILVFTFPLIGNYGVQLKSTESDKIQVSGVIMSQLSATSSHLDSDTSLIEWLQGQNIPLITGLDTRALTKHLRTKGTMGGAIAEHKVKPGTIKLKSRFVSVDKPVIYNAGKSKTVILVDCGYKANILRSLSKLPVRVKCVPYDYDYSGEKYDGVLLSNGPGDPTDYKATIKVAAKALKNDKPVFGICLGSQIMGLAAGAKTYKLKFGHRGHNQPCMETDANHCYITSQNHGYAIKESSLPKNWGVWFRNLNDSSIEGIKHKAKPFFSVQFHPEASPGPTDTEWLFKKFADLL